MNVGEKRLKLGKEIVKYRDRESLEDMLNRVKGTGPQTNTQHQKGDRHCEMSSL